MIKQSLLNQFLLARAAGADKGLCWIAVIVAISCVTMNASAWEFDDASCAPNSSYETETLPPPQAMLMVDRSGSMDGTIRVPCTRHQCRFYGSYRPNACYYSGQYCEHDPWPNGDDWYSGSGTMECEDCQSTADCYDAADDFFRPLAHAADDGWLGGAGEYCGDHGKSGFDLNNYYHTSGSSRSVYGATRTCDHCRSSSDCADFADSIWASNSLWGTYYSTVNCGTSNKSLWEIAKDSIDALVNDMTGPDPDDVRFGLGLFYGSTATIRLNAKEDAHSDIMSILNSSHPYGGTPMANAIRTMRTSSTIQNAAGGSAGVLLTDGVPSSSRDDTIRAACEHRDDAPLYVVGFGGGTNEDFNDALAGAGGTGSCTGGDPCTGPYQYSSWYWSGRCDGSVQANNETELQNALNSIGEQISCTFDVDDLAGGSSEPIWDESRQGCNDYDCLRVRLNGSVSSRIYHMSSSQGPRGWEWSSSAHTQIRLLNSDEGADDNYCQKMRNGELVDPAESDIQITRACMCTQNTGDSCGSTDMVPSPSTCDCPVGTWSCQQGSDLCEPNRPGDCSEPLIGEGGTCTVGVGECQRTGAYYCTSSGAVECSATPGEPEPEVCDGLDNDCGGLADELETADDDTPGGLVHHGNACHVDFLDNPGAAEQNAIATETMRCNIGFRGCSNGSYTCEPLDPMPEVCNGIDDDCDTRIDDLSDGWNHDDFNGYSLDDETQGAACFERNVCSCPNGPDAIEGDDFDSFIDGWTNGSNPPDPTCVCGEGLVE